MKTFIIGLFTCIFGAVAMFLLPHVIIQTAGFYQVDVILSMSYRQIFGLCLLMPLFGYFTIAGFAKKLYFVPETEKEDAELKNWDGSKNWQSQLNDLAREYVIEKLDKKAKQEKIEKEKSKKLTFGLIWSVCLNLVLLMAWGINYLYSILLTYFGA